MTEVHAAADEEPEEGTELDWRLLTVEEAEDLNSAESTVLPVTYSGQDFDVNGLVRRLNSEDILVPTFGHQDPRIASAGFQRSFVWNRPQMDRFIESLLLGYPIPGIFLVRQSDRRYLVLDGQQRLRTLQYFYRGIYDGKEFALSNVATAFKGLTYDHLSDEQRRLIDDAFIQATIVSTDGTSDSLESIFQIFERLNSGGTQLTPHEIRVALFAGPFIDYLEELNRDTAWRKLYGKPNPRLRDQELVLRILALFLNADHYRRPLKSFLNDFVASHRTLDNFDSNAARGMFGLAAELINGATGPEALRRQGAQINAAMTETIFVGLMRRVASANALGPEKVERAIRILQEDERLQQVISRATADEESVKTRLEIGTRVFAEV
jgi:hypothetical protein